jgi:hypothetical protein
MIVEKYEKRKIKFWFQFWLIGISGIEERMFEKKVFQFHLISSYAILIWLTMKLWFENSLIIFKFLAYLNEKDYLFMKL